MDLRGEEGTEGQGCGCERAHTGWEDGRGVEEEESQKPESCV